MSGLKPGPTSATKATQRPSPLIRQTRTLIGCGAKRRGAAGAAPAFRYSPNLCCGFGAVLRVLVGGNFESRLGLNGEGSEAGGVVGGDVGEDLAVEAVA